MEAISDPIRILVDKHMGLIDNMYLIRTLICNFLKTASPHLFEDLKREFLLFLKTMDEHMRCEEEVLFPILKHALGTKNAPIISMTGEHEDLKARMERIRTIMTNMVSENAEECRKAIKIVDEEIDSLIDLFYRHTDKEEKCLFKLAREVLTEGNLLEIGEKMKKIGI